KNGFELIQDAFYDIENINESIKSKWQNWFEKYANRLQKESLSAIERKQKMNDVNPKYVLRNYMAQLAIDTANLEDYALIDELFQLLKKPYDEQPKHQKWFAKRPDWARDKVGCSMLSCSS
ncbi:MAG: protein adenylyltransferase SelO family protein, partial [Polaribacter sp.]|nr:protein adenylyltransferase SelO family protein [Polaribacter sp.]